MSSFEPSKYQLDILDFVRNKRGNLLVDAKAGSGKTSTLCLISDEIIKQNKKCLFLAFNKSIVTELQSRIISDNVQIKTLHSLGLSFLRSYLFKKYRENYELVIDQHDDRIRDFVEDKFAKICLDDFNKANCEMGDQDRKDLLKDVLRELAQLVNYSRLYNINYHESDKVISLAEKLCWNLKNYEDIGLKKFPVIIEMCIDAIKESFENPEKVGDKYVYTLGYTDMIYFPCLYRMDPPFNTRQFLEYVMCDESQDLSVLQQLFLKRLDNGYTRYIMVGDEKQCQPAGTKVLMKDKSLKNIEDIVPGDKVVGYIDKKHPHFTKNNDNLIVNDIQHSKSDKLYKITLDNNSTSSYTYNHICYARIREDKINGYIVYLMRNADGYYRIGKAKMYVTDFRGFGLRLRLRQENCVDAWILNYCETDKQAWVLEQELSLKYGIPQLIFHKVSENQRCDYNLVKEIHDYIGKSEIEKRAIQLLKDYNRSIEFPFLSLYDNKHISHKHNFTIHACNIIPEIMQCIIKDDTNINNRKNNIRATYVNIKNLEILQGKFDVYCLDVAVSNNYIADGILTHNCIYGFAGADTNSIQNLKRNFVLEELPLNVCYRCPENVIRLAKEIVPTIDWNHKREDIGEVKFVNEVDLKDLVKPGDVILARRNNDLVRLYKKLVLDDKISMKFKNTEMVSAIVNEIKRNVKEYIKKYNTYSNVEKDLYRICDENDVDWKKADNKMSREDKSFMQTKFKELVKLRKANPKSISKSNYTVDYLDLCMKEYKEEGEYNFTYDGMPENVLVEYFDVIESLVQLYREKENGFMLNDLLLFIESFLKGNMNREVPILSSIHMMKGGEANNVYIIDYPRFPYIYSSQTDDVKQQERNLQYVALTRPKKNLYLCKIARCKNQETEDMIKEKNMECELHVRSLIVKDSNNRSDDGLPWI